MDSDASWPRRLQTLIGHTLIALSAGLWAAVTPLDFETGLLQVVEAGGDADTNVAVRWSCDRGALRCVVGPGALARVCSRA